MRIRSGIGLAILLSFAVLCSGNAAGDPAPNASAESLATLLPLLSHDDFGTRELAARRIVKLGESVLAPLRQASTQHRELEVRLRARRIVREIMDSLCLSKSTGMEFAAIDAGQFQMGSPPQEPNRRDDEPGHNVRISSQFLIGAREVTQREFDQIMGFQPSAFAPTGTDKHLAVGLETAQWPVESVSWFDAVEFCNRLSKADGFAPYYSLANVERQGPSIKAALVAVLGGHGYRLPTEAEWEYACRAASTSPYHFGAANSGKEANLKPGPSIGYGGSPTWKTLDRPTKVGSYPPNSWGLRDTHGNVNEWCWDWYDKDYYLKGRAVDPQGPAQGTHRVVRGGSWLVMEGSCRSASRLMLSPESTTNYVGFRVARSP